MYFYKLQEFIKYNLESFWNKSFNGIKLSLYNIRYHRNAFFSAWSNTGSEMPHLFLIVEITHWIAHTADQGHPANTNSRQAPWAGGEILCY